MSATEPTPTWPRILGDLLAGRSLSTAETEWAMDVFMRGEATGAQIAAFVVGLRAKGETAHEVRGLVQAMLRHATPLEVTGITLDIVGTGGDQARTVNVSTMSAVLAAAAGAPVVKHGSRAASSACGSADVLQALGVAIEMPVESVERVFRECGITFCFAPVFHPALRHTAPVRRDLGVPTVFNILGPLANPSRPSAMLVGCADERLAPVMADVLAGRGVRALVVRGDDGIDEVTTTTTTTIWDARAREPRQVVLDPTDLGIARVDSEALRGGDATVNASIARAVLGPQDEARTTAVRDAVALNAALGLVVHDVAIGAASGEEDLLEVAAKALMRVRGVLADGSALRLLDRWAEVSAAAS